MCDVWDNIEYVWFETKQYSREQYVYYVYMYNMYIRLLPAKGLWIFIRLIR